MFRYILAAPSKARLSHFGGGFRLVKDAAKAVKARAAINFGFFSMSKNHPVDSYPVGEVAIGGYIHVTPAPDARHFHAVYSQGGRIKIADQAPVLCDWSITAGPRLVESGKVCERSISDSRWPAGGVSVTARKPRVAIGVRADGQVRLAYWDDLNIREGAQRMLDLGCLEALAGDGGGSASWYDSENPSHSVSQRLVPNMIWVEGEDVKAPPTPAEGGDKQMIVCIDPGHGGPDPGAVASDGTQEKKITLPVSIRLADYLRRAGAQVVLTRETDTDLAAGLDDKEEMLARARIANNAKAVYCISIHANSVSDASVSGLEALYWPGSKGGEALSRSILDSLRVATGLPIRRSFGSALLLHSYTSMVCVTVELGFLTNSTDRALLKEPSFQDKCALGIAQGILNAAT